MFVLGGFSVLFSSVRRPHRFRFFLLYHFCRHSKNIHVPSKQKRISLCRRRSKQSTSRVFLRGLPQKKPSALHRTSLNANGVGILRPTPVTGSLYSMYKAQNLDFTFISPKFKLLAAQLHYSFWELWSKSRRSPRPRIKPPDHLYPQQLHFSQKMMLLINHLHGSQNTKLLKPI